MAEIESEGELHRSEIAAFLREFADELDAPGRRSGSRRGGEPPEAERDADREVDRDRTTDEDVEAGGLRRMTLVVGGDSATLTLPETMAFDVEIASRSPLLSSGVTQSIEFDLEWEVEEMPDDESIEVM